MKPQDACPLQARQTRTSARPPGAGGVAIIDAARVSHPITDTSSFGGCVGQPSTPSLSRKRKQRPDVSGPDGHILDGRRKTDTPTPLRNPHDLTIILSWLPKPIVVPYRPELVNGAFAYRMPRRYGVAKALT